MVSRMQRVIVLKALFSIVWNLISLVSETTDYQIVLAYSMTGCVIVLYVEVRISFAIAIVTEVDTEVLGVSEEELSKMLLMTKIMIPRQECIFKAMDKNECKANLNTLCKAIYNTLFEWILSRLESALNPPVEM